MGETPTVDQIATAARAFFEQVEECHVVFDDPPPDGDTIAELYQERHRLEAVLKDLVDRHFRLRSMS